MSGDDKDDQALENYLQGKDGITSQYRQQADETPSEQMDAAILAASRKAVGARPQKSTAPFSGRWHVPVSIAAVMVLSVLLVFNIQDEESVIGTAPSMDTDTAPAVSESLSREISKAADNAVSPELETMQSSQSPQASASFRAESFVEEAAEGIESGLTRSPEDVGASSRILQRAMERQPDIDLDAQRSAQADNAAAGAGRDEPPITECVVPRPEVCTEQYEPVCAIRDTGVRCVTMPCESTERMEYGNACNACSDPDVIGYIEGACE